MSLSCQPAIGFRKQQHYLVLSSSAQVLCALPINTALVVRLTMATRDPLLRKHHMCVLQFLYDLVFEKDDPNFSGANKTHRDTLNPTILSKDRVVGSMMTTSKLSHGPPESFHKPQYARKPIVRDTFYRKTNIFFPDSGCAGAVQD